MYSIFSSGIKAEIIRFYAKGLGTLGLSVLFGSELREKVLVYIEECGEAYSLELSKNFGASLFAVQNQLKRLAYWSAGMPEGRGCIPSTPGIS